MNGIRKLRLDREWSMADLAEKAKTTTSTIKRLEDGTARLDEQWLDKFSEIFGVDWYAVAGRGAPGQPTPSYGFSEDAEPFKAPKGHLLANVALGENRDLWRVTTDALDAIGIGASDLIVVDISSTAVEAVATGDAVVVQLIDPTDSMKATTLLRQFIEPDLFITNSRQANLHPLNRAIDDVRIKGVIVQKVADVRRRLP